MLRNVENIKESFSSLTLNLDKKYLNRKAKFSTFESFSTNVRKIKDVVVFVKDNLSPKTPIAFERDFISEDAELYKLDLMSCCRENV